MKAAVYTRFGPPDVLKLREVQKPVPKKNEVLVRIRATTVEKEDPMLRRSPGMNGIFGPKRKVLGMELAGEIESVGNEVPNLKAGDQIFGNAGLKLGAYAEYICLPCSGAIALKPTNLSFPEAAACTNGALTALPYLRDLAKIRQGQSILINGASGTVGSSALQLAKYFGARVTGVCRTSNMDRVRSLGADRVLDYTKETVIDCGETFDIIFDVAGNLSFTECKKKLKESGTFMSTVPSLRLLFNVLNPTKNTGKKYRFAATGLRSPEKKSRDLAFLKTVIEAGGLRPVIDREFPLAAISEAHSWIESGRKNGTVVINIE